MSDRPQTNARDERGTRHEIQALRAVAVLSVVVYHVWPAALPGGYVGVDIFFVISGFLITSHLVREVHRTGTIKLTQFWARRIRRLLPASLTVLAVCTAATLLLPWGQWFQNWREIGSAALYVENWRLVSDSVDYLAAENVPSLVQHFWSLSVEEQFYIAWPLLILLALLLTRRHTGIRRTLGIALGIVFVLSLLTSVVWTHRASAGAYFSTATRAWEFAAGGLLAFLPTLPQLARTERVRTGVHLAASWGGLALIAAALAFFTESMSFPGVIALLPVLGAAAFIWAEQSNSRLSPTVAGGVAPVQFIGDVSYSVYLWHWPLVILFPVLSGDDAGLVGGLAIVGASLVLGWLSKRFIEDPFRTASRWRPRRRSYGFAASGMAAVAVACLAATLVVDVKTAAAEETTEFTSVAQLQDAVAETLTTRTWPFPDQLPNRDAFVDEWIKDDCKDVDTDEARERCVYGDPDADKTIVLVGDSFATHFLPALREAFGDDYRIEVMTLGECPPATFSVRTVGVDTEFTECATHNAHNIELLTADPPDLIIASDTTAGSYGRMLVDGDRATRVAAYRQGVHDGFAQLQGTGVGAVVVLESPPKANCAANGILSSPQDCAPDLDTNRTFELQQAKFDEAASLGIPVVDTTPWLCTDDGICPDQVGTTLMKADGAHFTEEFSQDLGGILRTAILDAIG
ncbi:MAG: acyltransferase family protein [Microbacterium sp.]